MFLLIMIYVDLLLEKQSFNNIYLPGLIVPPWNQEDKATPPPCLKVVDTYSEPCSSALLSAPRPHSAPEHPGE